MNISNTLWCRTCKKATLHERRELDVCCTECHSITATEHPPFPEAAQAMSLKDDVEALKKAVEDVAAVWPPSASFAQPKRSYVAEQAAWSLLRSAVENLANHQTATAEVVQPVADALLFVGQRPEDKLQRDMKNISDAAQGLEEAVAASEPSDERIAQIEYMRLQRKANKPITREGIWAAGRLWERMEWERGSKFAAVVEIHADENNYEIRWLIPEPLPMGTKLYTHPPTEPAAVGSKVPDGWQLVPKVCTPHQYESMKVLAECMLESVNKLDLELLYATGLQASPAPPAEPELTQSQYDAFCGLQARINELEEKYEPSGVSPIDAALASAAFDVGAAVERNKRHALGWLPIENFQDGCVLVKAPELIDADFNTEGIGEAVLCGDEWVAAQWDNEQDYYKSVPVTPTHFMLRPEFPDQRGVGK